MISKALYQCMKACVNSKNIYKFCKLPAEKLFQSMNFCNLVNFNWIRFFFAIFTENPLDLYD
jgi:hypothetical protein